MAVKAGTARKKPGRITALLCENSAWKAYVDAAGEGPRAARALGNLDAVKLPCSGKVEVGLILKLLETGSAGVLVLGCPKDNCTFIRGNYRAEKRIGAAKAALREAGLDEGLVRLDFLSSLDSRKLIDAVVSFKGYIDDHSRS
jgi:coenzyme F420-reducing hydrogenase delta subunit